jgi:hypothetical protein
MKIPLLALAAIATLASTSAFAHHGRDFILVQDYSAPVPGSVFLMGNFEWEKGSGGSEFGLSPSLMVGVLPRVSLAVEGSFRDEVGTDWRYTSVTPSANIQLTPLSSQSPVRFGLSVGYQFADSVSEEVPDAHNEEAEGSGEHADEPDDEHAAEAEATGHHHGEGVSIHNHDDNALIARFITEADLGRCKAVFNLINVTADHGSTAWGYGVALRRPVSDCVALGVESLGDFKSDGWHELGVAGYIEPSHHFTMKVGISFGLTDATPDLSVRTGFVYRF